MFSREPELVVPVEESSKKKKKKKKKNKEKSLEGEVTESESPQQNGGLAEENAEVKQKKKKKHKGNNEAENTEGSNEVTSQEETPNTSNKENKKKKKTSKNVDKTAQAQENSMNETSNGIIADVNNKKENKKDKSNNEDAFNTTEVTSKVTDVAEVTSNKKKKKRNRTNSIGNSRNVDEIVETKKKHRLDTFVVEEVSNQGPSQESNQSVSHKFTKHSNDSRPVKGVKRKLDARTDADDGRKRKKQDFAKISNNKNNFKMKFNNKDKFKNKKKVNNKQSKDSSNDNPLSKLSDERLKAYGLNPKKYKNFLKYKKF